MKIIKAPIIPVDWKMQVTCCHCRGEFEITKEDIRTTSRYEANWDCPIEWCKEYNELRFADLDPYIVSYVKSLPL